MTSPTFSPAPPSTPRHADGPYAPPADPYASPAQRRSFGPSTALAVAGAGALGCSFTVLQWFRKDYSSVSGHESKASFSDLHHALDALQRKLSGNPFGRLIDVGFSPTYFSWLGWALLAAAVVTAAVAVSPAGTPTARAAGAVVGAAALGLTLWNLQLFTVSAGIARSDAGVPDGYLDWLKHTSFGAWAAIGGFLLLGIASAVGPRRR